MDKNNYSKLYTYGCGKQIYWNTTKKSYYEVETGNRHLCQNPNSNRSNTQTTTTTNQPRPTYYNAGTGKPLTTQQTNKQQHSNSIQILKGTEEQVQKQYETLADILSEVNGRIHGSQSHYLTTGGIVTNNRVKDVDGYYRETATNELRVVVYYEVPGTAEQREEIKQKFNLILRTN
jgi:hypothetical protein